MLKMATAAAAAMIAFSVQAQDATADLTEGDAAAGERVFRQCRACHTVGGDAANRVGPHLNDLFGRVPGTIEGFSYSPAMEEFGQSHVWDAETLHGYLQAPRDVVPGTKMAFAGVRREGDLVDLLAFLAQNDEQGFTVE